MSPVPIEIRKVLLRHGRTARNPERTVRFLERDELDKRVGSAISDEALAAVGASPDVWQGEARLADGRYARAWLNVAVLELSEAERSVEEDALERRRVDLRKPEIGTV